MKRDMDLVRDILLETELSNGPLQARDLVTPEHDAEEVAFHVCLMKNHGLLDASGDMLVLDNGNTVKGRIVGLTWDGFDYLEAIRDNSVWRKTKDAVKEAVGSTTFAIIKQTAELVAMQAIKANLGVV